MRTKCSKRPKLWSLMALVLAPLPGCELLVDFDRSKIPQDGGPNDAMSIVDGTTSEGSASTDATTDAAGDAAVLDAATDGLVDGSADSGVDASVADGAVVGDGPPLADSPAEGASGDGTSADGPAEAGSPSDGSGDVASGDDSG